MAYTFSFTTRGSSVTAYFPENIDVSDGFWEMGLVSFHTYMTMPNITEDNNKIRFHQPKNANWPPKVVEIPVGSYTIPELELAIRERLPEKIEFSLHMDPNRFRSIIYSNKDIDFKTPGSPQKLLGFPEKELKGGESHMSTDPVRISPINVLRVHCNITRGSYIDGQNAHLIHEFFPEVPGGYKIVEQPHNIIYLPINVRRIDHITLTLTDQDGNLVDFQGEAVTIRLHLKRWG